jgi:hypothetical protein
MSFIMFEGVDELFSWKEWFCVSSKQIRNDKDCLSYFATWIQIALDNDDPKMHEETSETHEETSEMCEVIDDQKVEAKKDVDMEDTSSFGTTWWDKKEDNDLGLFIDVFDNLSEKDEMKKLEQDFVNSDSEEQVWEPSSPTSLFKKDSNSNEKEKEPITGPFTKVSKFVSILLSPSNFFFSNYLLQQHWKNIKSRAPHFSFTWWKTQCFMEVYWSMKWV